MRLLLDTHVVLWWLNGDPVDDAAAARIADAGTDVYVSAASVWEIAIKAAIGKLTTDADLMGALAAGDFERLPVSWEHAAAVGALPHHHRDPFDRLLIAQAQCEGLTLVTRDPAVRRYEVPTLRA